MKDSHPDFPIHIDLGKEMKEEARPGAEMELGEAEEGSGEAKKFYPTLYVNDISGIDKVPEDGYVLVKLKRKRLIEEASEEEGKEYDAEFEVHEMCLPEETEESESMEDGDSIDELAEKAGIDTGKKKAKKKEAPKEEYSDKEVDEES